MRNSLRTKGIIIFCYLYYLITPCYTSLLSIQTKPIRNDSKPEFEAISDDILQSVHLTPVKPDASLPVINTDEIGSGSSRKDLDLTIVSQISPDREYDDDEAETKGNTDPPSSSEPSSSSTSKPTSPEQTTEAEESSSTTEETNSDEGLTCNKILVSEQTIQSPNYPDLYPTQYNETWCFKLAEGPSINILIESMDLNPNMDFVIIKGGHGDDETEYSKIITGKETNLSVLISHTNKAMITFSSNQETNTDYKGFQLHVTSNGEHSTTTETPSSTVPIYTGDLVTITKSLIISREIKNQTDIYDVTIRNALVDATNKWIQAHNYTDLLEPCRSENVIIKRVANCSSNWPNFEDCIRMEFAIPLNETDLDFLRKNAESGLDPVYELTVKNMEQMWLEFGREEIQNAGFSEYITKNASIILTIWITVSLVVVAAFLLVLYMIVKMDFSKVYRRMSEDQTNEERNSKKKIDPTMVTPTDQVWPPFLSGEEVFNSGFDPETVVYDIRSQEASPKPLKHTVTFASEIVDFNEPENYSNPFAAEIEARRQMKDDQYQDDEFLESKP